MWLTRNTGGVASWKWGTETSTRLLDYTYTFGNEPTYYARTDDVCTVLFWTRKGGRGWILQSTAHMMVTKTSCDTTMPTTACSATAAVGLLCTAAVVCWLRGCFVGRYACYLGAWCVIWVEIVQVVHVLRRHTRTRTRTRKHRSWLSLRGFHNAETLTCCCCLQERCITRTQQ